MDLLQVRRQQKIINHLNNATFIVMDLCDEEGVAHYYTVGLCRFGVRELYVCGPAPTATKMNPEHDPMGDLIAYVADHHLARPFLDGPVTLPSLRHELTEEQLNLVAKNLRGAELYTTATRLYDAYEKQLGWRLDVLYQVGICQLLWPDENNLAFDPQLATEFMTMQVIKPTSVH